jgi:hypothetical protein
VTELVEDITIKISLNHCLGNSKVLAGKHDLRGTAYMHLMRDLPEWIASRKTHASMTDGPGIKIEFENTGLYEAPEIGGGDN